MNPAVYVLAGTMLTVAGGVVAVLLKNSKGSPESRTAESQGWALLNGGLVAEVKRLTEGQVQTNTQMEHQLRRIADLETNSAAQAAALAKVQRLNGWLTRRVEQLVAFIVNHDLVPPEAEPQPDDTD